MGIAERKGSWRVRQKLAGGVMIQKGDKDLTEGTAKIMDKLLTRMREVEMDPPLSPAELKLDFITFIFEPLLHADEPTSKGEVQLAAWTTARLNDLQRPSQATMGYWLHYMIDTSTPTSWSTINSNTNRIPATFQELPVQKVRVSHLVLMVQQLRDQGFAPNTVYSTYQTARQALQCALNDGEIPFNPADRMTTTQRPQKVRKRRRAQFGGDNGPDDVLTDDEREMLLAKLRDLWVAGQPRGQFYGQVMAFLWLLLRRGELLGLKKNKLDFEAGLVLIDEQERAFKKPDFKVRGPKIPKGKTAETLPLTGDIVEVLQDHIAVTAEKLKERGCITDLVFPTNIGTAHHPDGYTIQFKRMTKKLIGRSVGPHVLRNTGITLMLDAGIAPTLVQTMARHKDLAETLRYHRELMTAQDATRVALEELHAKQKASKPIFPRLVE